MTSERMEEMRARLTAAFDPLELEIIDESDRHRGHAGARDGRGHFRVRIVSERFEGLKPIECHRLVFAALDSLLRTDIHALSVQATSRNADARS